MSSSPLNTPRTILVTGVAGFIGSQLTDLFLRDGHTVIGIDNFSRGTRENIAAALQSPRFRLIEANLADEAAVLGPILEQVRSAGIAEVWHLAANSDIPAGIADYRVDLRDTFFTTTNTLALMRALQIPVIAFASTSAVYGERDEVLSETTGPLLPISNYGAMKLASEAMISAAVEAYLKQAFIFRFPNVLGPRLTHGIIYDLLAKLERDPSQLEVLGNGTQQKPYLHTQDLIEAMLFIRNHATDKVSLYNVGPDDDGARVSDIAQAVLDGVHSTSPIRYTGGDRGWVGDVPRVRYSLAKLHKLGWACASSSVEAVRRTVREVVADRDGKAH